VSGGTWAKAPEGVIGDLQTLGFNMLGYWIRRRYRENY